MNKKDFISQVLDLFKKIPILSFFAIFFVLFIISVLNNFPKGYVFSYSDFPQLVNFKGTLKWFTDSFVDYGEGNLNFLYVPFYYSFLGFIQNFIGTQFMSIAYSFIFLAGSFSSFYIATRFYRIDTKNDISVRICFSFLYALNSYTAIRFILPSMYFLPYVFIPVLFATAHAYFIEPKVLSKNLFWCAGAMLISTVCWVNPPYFVAYSLLIYIYIILSFITHRKLSLLVFIKKLINFSFIFLSSFAVYIFTWPALLLSYRFAIQAGKYQVNNLEWIYSQSLTMLDVFSFRTRLFGLVNTNQMIFILLIFSCFYLFLFSIGSFLVCRKIIYKKINFVFMFMIIIVGFLLNKGAGFPWEAYIHSVFANNLFLCSLRSFDKILVFLPFMLIMPCFLSSSCAKNKIRVLILLIPTYVFIFPFIYGNLYKKLYSVERGKNYLTSRYACLVKIPQEYFDVISKINWIKSDFKIFDVPWSLENPDLKNWIISEKWKHCGANPIIQYSTHPFVQMNEPSSFDDWNYGIQWGGENSKESFWLMPLSGMLNTKYLIFHKDVLEKFVSEAAPKIAFYKDSGFIKLLTSNSYFDFFEISDTYLLPHFYVPNRIYVVKNSSAIPSILNNALLQGKPAILESSDKLETSGIFNYCDPVIEYKKIGVAKYKVKFHGITKSFSFIFSETFYKHWKVYPVSYSKPEKYSLLGYKVFEHNEDYQATKSELKTYLEKGWISELGSGSEKIRKVVSWVKFLSPQTNIEKYRFDFVSKITKGTIQNDNISNGYFYDTWFLKAVDEKFHRIVNGYANYWLVDLDYLKKDFPGLLKTNLDGSSDLEVIIEFWPQKPLNMSRTYTIIFAILILFLLISAYIQKKRI